MDIRNYSSILTSHAFLLFFKVLCAGRCEKNNPSSCYTPEQKCDGVPDCAYGQDETSCDSVDSDAETPTSASRKVALQQNEK